MTSLHRSPSEGKPLFSEQMKLCTWALATVAEYPTLQHSDITCNPPPPFRREKPNVPAQRSGEPFFQQKRFPVPRISVPGRKHTFLLVVL